MSPNFTAQRYLFWEYACAYSNEDPVQTIEGLAIRVEAIKFLSAPSLSESIPISKLSNYSYCGTISGTGLGGCSVSITTENDYYCLSSRLARIKDVLNGIEHNDSFEGCVYDESDPRSTIEGMSLDIDGFSL